MSQQSLVQICRKRSHLDHQVRVMMLWRLKQWVVLQIDAERILQQVRAWIAMMTVRREVCRGLQYRGQR